jgi:hypothetical protein
MISIFAGFTRSKPRPLGEGNLVRRTAYTSLRFAGAEEHGPTRPGSVRATQSGVTGTALSHSLNSASLRWLGQEGSLGAERFASTVGRSLPRG